MRDPGPGRFDPLYRKIVNNEQKVVWGTEPVGASYKTQKHSEYSCLLGCEADKFTEFLEEPAVSMIISSTPAIEICLGRFL